MTEWKVSEIHEPQAQHLPAAQEGAADTENPTAVSLHTITSWAEEDRPREKLMTHGAEALTDAELLAILIGSGTSKVSAVDLMRKLLHDCDNNLAILSKMSLERLMEYKGIGTAKAVTIQAACEFGRRREQSKLPERLDLSTPENIYQLMWPRMRDLDVEEAYVILLDRRMQLIDTVRLSHGGMTETAVDVRLIIKHALAANATVLALVHNHPSGNATPSRDDDKLTHNVNEACRIMRLYMADHIIITDGKYYSYREEGKL